MSQVDQANPTKSFREIYPVKPKGAEKKSGKGTEVKHISLFGLFYLDFSQKFLQFLRKKIVCEGTL